jgi:hypothetical protein
MNQPGVEFGVELTPYRPDEAVPPPSASTSNEAALGRDDDAAAPTLTPGRLSKSGKPLRGAALRAALRDAPPTTLGLRREHDWKGSWGRLDLLLSRLGRFKRKIRDEIVAEYERPDGRPLSPFQQRLVEHAAEAGALARQAQLLFGAPPAPGRERVTRRTVSVAMKSFTKHVADLERLGGLRRKDAGPVDVATSLRQASRQGQDD